MRWTVTALWVVALFVAVSPWFAVPSRLSDGYPRIEVLFTLAVVAAAVALAPASVGLAVVIRSKGHVAGFALAEGFLALNFVAVAAGASAWFSIPTCSGGQSGPCMTPLLLCAGGLVATLIAAVFAGIGLLLIHRRHRHQTTPPSG